MIGKVLSTRCTKTGLERVNTYTNSTIFTFLTSCRNREMFYCCQVLDVRKRQLDDKMEENKRRQQESIESREELLRELEEVQRMTAREKAEELRQRRQREEEIQAQVRIITTTSGLRALSLVPEKSLCQPG